MTATSTAGRGSRGIAAVTGRVALRYSVLVLFLLGWELFAGGKDDPLYPAPSDLAAYMNENWLGGPARHLWLADVFVENVLPSLGRVFAGWLIAGVLGIALGMLIGRSALATDFLGPLLTFFRSVPPPALLSVVVALVHGTNTQILLLIVLGIVWPVLLNTVDGVRSVHPTQRDTALAFRISRPRWLLRVVLPAAAPKIFAGLRLSLSLALILAVIAEYLGGSEGIGYQLQDAQSLFDSEQAWALVVLLGVIGYVLNSALLVLQRRTLGWQSETATRPVG